MKQSRILVFAALVLALWSCGRKLEPRPTDTNKSPETVLVATPFDTTFLKTPEGGIPTAVIYRYHAHWFGSDPDGKVVGFVVVVTDTNGVPPLSALSDPRFFTTRTDSIFSFRVISGARRYPHTLWVTAVDNKGKADFSPAHVILNAEDRFLPEPMLIYAYALTPSGKQIMLNDASQGNSVDPRDTIPFGSSVHFRWRGVSRDPSGLRVVSYKVRIGSIVATTTADSLVVSPASLKPGRIEFHIKAVDEIGGETGAGGEPDTVRLFAYNFAPGTWNADPNTLSSPPEMRPLQQRFFEVRNGQYLLHADGDTVPRSSSIRLVFGGWDRDGQVRGFSVGIKERFATSGNDLPPTPTSPPPGKSGVFEPFVKEPFDYTVGVNDARACVRIFSARAFDYEGQVDRKGSSIRIVFGFRPFFKANEVTFKLRSTGATLPVFPDTVLIPASEVTVDVRAVAYDGNDRTGRTALPTNGNRYTFVLDPESDAVLTTEAQSGLFVLKFKDAHNQNLAPGLHILEVTANDYIFGGQQSLDDGRVAKVRIPFFFGQRTR